LTRTLSRKPLLLLTVLAFVLFLTPAQPYNFSTTNTGSVQNASVKDGKLSFNGGNRGGLLGAGAIQPVFAYGTGQYASLELGQKPASFIEGSAWPFTQYGLFEPKGLGVDSHGNVWVADYYDNRVLEFTRPFSNGENAVLVLGQSGYGTYTAADTPSGMNGPSGVAVDSSGNLWVADAGNNRVLEFTCTATSTCSNGNTAVMVLGQSAFNTKTAADTMSGMSGPTGLTFDSNHWLWVSDTGNNRVLEFTCTATSTCSNGSDWVEVLGQSYYGTNTAADTQNGMSGPRGLGFDGSSVLWVADYGNNRVLGFVCTARENCAWGSSASVELGQPSGATAFTTNTAATSQSGMSGPSDVVTDSHGYLWVSDFGNNRVLEFTCDYGYGCSDGNDAVLVLGQSGFSTKTSATSQNGIWEPYGLGFDYSGNLWVADHVNSRVLAFWANEVTADSDIITLSGGDGSFTSSLTSMTVTISGSTASASVFILPQTLSTQNYGLPTFELNNPKLFDVAISGITTGTANVCVPDSLADSATVIQYWNGIYFWSTASSITVTDGTSVCGNIPVSSLQGNNIGAGDPVTPTTTTTTTLTSTSITATTSSTSTTSTFSTITGSTTLSAVTNAPTVTGTMTTTSTVTGPVAGTATTIYTTILSTSTSTSLVTSSVGETTTETGVTTLSTGTSTSTATETAFATTTAGGTVTVTETNTFNVLLTNVFHELHQFADEFLQLVGVQPVVTPFGQQVNSVQVTVLTPCAGCVTSTKTALTTLTTVVATLLKGTTTTATSTASATVTRTTPVVFSTTQTATRSATATKTLTSTATVTNTKSVTVVSAVSTSTVTPTKTAATVTTTPTSTAATASVTATSTAATLRVPATTTGTDTDTTQVTVTFYSYTNVIVTATSTATVFSPTVTLSTTAATLREPATTTTVSNTATATSVSTASVTNTKTSTQTSTVTVLHVATTTTQTTAAATPTVTVVTTVTTTTSGA